MEELYINKSAARTLIDSYITPLTTPQAYAANDAMKQLRNKFDLMPTLTKSELFNTAHLVWWEEWSPSTPESPRECIGGGWQCSNCGIDLGDYITKCGGEHCYFDRYEEKPAIAFCPCCGRKFN